MHYLDILKHWGQKKVLYKLPKGQKKSHTKCQES